MQLLLALGAIAGFTGVAFGAFGGHGLRKKLADAPEGPKRLEWWQTGSSYHQVHAVAIGEAQRRLEHRDDRRHMLPGGQLGDDAAVAGVQVGLRGDHVREHGAALVDDRGRRLVTGCLDCQNVQR